MPDKLVHCNVVEIDEDAHLLSAEDKGPPRDLLPWADPYIARLLTKYRLQAALDDSLRFVSDQSRRGFTGAAPAEVDRGPWTPFDLGARFRTCGTRRPLPPATEDRSTQ